MARRPAKKSASTPAKKSSRKKRPQRAVLERPISDKTRNTIRLLIETLLKQQRTSSEDIENILTPFADAFGAYELARRNLEHQVNVFPRYMNGILNRLLSEGYLIEEITLISNYIEGARIAFEEHALVGIEACAQHLDDAVLALAAMLEHGTRDT